MTDKPMTAADKIEDAINSLPGIHVTEYGASMVGRQAAIDAAILAVALASQPAEEPTDDR